MGLEFFRFDLRYQLRQPLLWITTVALVAVAFASAGSDSARVGGAIGNIHLNAPVVIARLLAILSFISMFLVTVFIAGSVLRDSEVGIADMIFATPMRKRDYLAGRFFAGFVACLLVFLLTTLALAAGTQQPSIDAARLGAFSWYPYIWSFAIFVMPNLLFVAALLFLLAVTARSMIVVYVGVLVFAVLWSVAGLLIQDVRLDWLAVMLDPFGIRALFNMTRYFSTTELNSHLPPVAGLLLLNRLVWSCVSLGLFAATLVFFTPQRAGTGRQFFGKSKQMSGVAHKATVETLHAFEPRFNSGTPWRQCWSIFRFDTKSVLKSVPFLVMLWMAIANFLANVFIGGLRFDSVPYPLTGLMLQELGGGFNFILAIVLAFYAGELVFRERHVKLADVSDAMPVPNWVPLVAKSAALAGVTLTFLGTGVLVAICFQLFKGGVPIEGMLYVKGILLTSVSFLLIGLCALALQVFANNKFTGYLLTIGLLLTDSVLNGFNLNNRLYNFASLPPLQYSDMNDYGHFLTGWAWHALYWSLFTVALLIVAQAFSVRGLSHRWRARCQSAIDNLRGPSAAGLVICLLGFGLTGAWIFYNSDVLNHYQANDVALDSQANYERLYRQYKDLPHPKITDVRADVDIYPAQRRVAIRGHYILQNKTTDNLDTLRIQCDPDVETVWDNLPPHQATLDDRKLGFSVLKLAQPLKPGATIAVDFRVNVRHNGFTNSGTSDTVNLNGTFFTDRNFFPKFGYDVTREIGDRNERRQRGLGEPAALPKLEDDAAHARNFYDIEADWINFDTTVSTSSDQLAIAPGNLVGKWESNGRRYFHYRMDKPMAPFFAYLSARWEVDTASWNGIPVEVYYDKKHAYNLGSMVSGAQDALSYYAEQFGPYPGSQVRILEFPSYGSIAQSFAYTIPFSESLGFINDLRNKDDVDHVFYVTAHEIAHQWWGDQLMAANMQGSAMVIESLAEYSALMVMEKKFGREKVRHILRFDLDAYLAGRSGEMAEELPLVRVSNQVYIAYRKASLVFYRLREEIGETALNRALRHFLQENRFRSAPYATSRDLLNFIRAETPIEKQSLVTDLFEKIVLYDDRVIEASARQQSDGQWEVTMKLHLSKFEADARGKESARAYDEPVEIAVFARTAGAPEKDERILFDESRVVAGGDSTLTVTVKEKPFEVGVDPYHLLIDRHTGEHRRQVSYP